MLPILAYVGYDMLAVSFKVPVSVSVSVYANVTANVFVYVYVSHAQVCQPEDYVGIAVGMAPALSLLTVNAVSSSLSAAAAVSNCTTAGNWTAVYPTFAESAKPITSLFLLLVFAGICVCVFLELRWCCLRCLC
jgi:hypothetical protein